jgi:hypothetical protein
MLLDQVVFEEEGFLLVRGDEGIQVRRLFQHAQGLQVSGRTLKIGPHSMAEVSRLAHIENFPPRVFKEIDSRVRGQSIDFSD